MAEEGGRMTKMQKSSSSDALESGRKAMKKWTGATGSGEPDAAHYYGRKINYYRGKTYSRRTTGIVWFTSPADYSLCWTITCWIYAFYDGLLTH